MGNTKEIHLFCFILFFSLSWYQHEHPSKDCFWTWRFPVVCQMHAGRKWLCQLSNMWRSIQTNDAAWRPSWCSASALEVGSVEGQLGYLLMNIWSKIMRWLHSFSKIMAACQWNDCFRCRNFITNDNRGLYIFSHHPLLFFCRSTVWITPILSVHLWFKGSGTIFLCSVAQTTAGYDGIVPWHFICTMKRRIFPF